MGLSSAAPVGMIQGMERRKNEIGILGLFPKEGGRPAVNLWELLSNVKFR